MLTRRGLIAGLAASAAILPAARLAAAPLAKVKELGVLRVGVYRDNRPWSWSENGGAPQGIDVDLAKALASELGVRADIVEFLAGEDVGDDLRNIVWRGGLLGFQPCDVMMHVPFDRQLQIDNDQVVLLAPYYRESFAAVCGTEQSDCDVPPPQFKGKRLAAELDSIPDMYLLGGFGGVLRSDVKHYMTGDAAVRAVRSGEADVAVATRAQVEHVAAEPNSQSLKRRRAPLQAIMSPGWDIGLAVKENSRSLGDVFEKTIEAMTADGRMAALCARFGVEWKPAVAAQPAG